MMFSILIALVVPCLATALGVVTSPVANVKNGTVVGKYVHEWDQDHFLGIPFAQPPVGPLRFARPRSIETKYNGPFDATRYGYSCYQYSNPSFNLSEDCLTLNGMYEQVFEGRKTDRNPVIRPAQTRKTVKLPVLVWVYGGGLTAGSTADPQYNVSGIAKVGQDLGKPVIVGLFSPSHSVFTL